MIDKLPAHQQECVERWLFEENLTYDQARSRLFEDFGVRVSSQLLVRFRQRCAQRRSKDALMDRVAEAAVKANQSVEAYEKNPGPPPAAVQSALSSEIGRQALQAFLRGEKPDLEEIKVLAGLALVVRKEDREDVKVELNQQQLALDREKFELLKAKAAKAEAAEGAMKDQSLTPEERQQRLKQIFGI